ncbi:hypothetical protein, partial [uncultured Alistipes sp.]|uniref:hypothetical protein n=1 Tax=uncultured Alistipes sp. TaxID=538949 RepID=UPI0026132F24
AAARRPAAEVSLRSAIVIRCRVSCAIRCFRARHPFAGWGGRAKGASRQRDEAKGFDIRLRIV